MQLASDYNQIVYFSFGIFIFIGKVYMNLINGGKNEKNICDVDAYFMY